MNQRFQSLDVFRGATVAFMILVNNPGSWDAIYAPLEHAPWHGCTPTDLVFPFFLFAVGNAMAFVMPRLQSAGDAAFLKKVFIRALAIFGIGLFLNWFPFMRWEDDHLVARYWVNPVRPDAGVRILGVLQRIAICYLLAALIIYYAKLRMAFVIGVAILCGYWAMCLLLGDPSDPFSMQGFFGLQVDKHVLGVAHMYKGEGVPFDPEGLASTLPAIVQVILGYMVGDYIRLKGKTHEMLNALFVAGCVMTFIGICWSGVLPLNKKIWTSSFVMYTSGLATLILSVLMHAMEFNGNGTKLAAFFIPFGKNPLFVFMLSGILPRLLGLVRWRDVVNSDGERPYITPLNWFWEHVCKPVSANEKNASLIYALIMVSFFWVIAYALDRKKIYVKV